MMDISKLKHHISWGQRDLTPYAEIIKLVMESNGIPAEIKGIICGISQARIELTLDRIRDYDRVMRLEKQIRAAMDIQTAIMTVDGMTVAVEFPIEGDALYLGDMLLNPSYTASDRLTIPVGRTTRGEDMFADIEDLKHILVAGTSGSGKSVFLQSLLLSIIAKNTNTQVYIIDPKMVEFSQYRVLDKCHVVTEISEAAGLLVDLCDLMDARYNALASAGVRDIDGYNANGGNMAHIILMVDELGDLMKQAKKETEIYLVRLAQKARACGIHLILATQYPTKDIVTGAIKQNMPTKVCFAVPTTTASVVMLGRKGAEMLQGKGDMYFQTEKDINPIRVQGAFATDNDRIKVIADTIRVNEQRRKAG